jgi:prefoldin beta subunit
MAGRVFGCSMAVKLEDLPPQVQNQIQQLQQFQQQYQVLIAQRQQIELRLMDTEKSLEELGKIEEHSPVYKNVGSILLKAKGKKEIIKELQEDKENLEVRKKTLEKQEERLKQKIEELQTKIQSSLAPQQAS